MLYVARAGSLTGGSALALAIVAADYSHPYQSRSYHSHEHHSHALKKEIPISRSFQDFIFRVVWLALFLCVGISSCFIVVKNIRVCLKFQKHQTKKVDIILDPCFSKNIGGKGLVRVEMCF